MTTHAVTKKMSMYLSSLCLSSFFLVTRTNLGKECGYVMMGQRVSTLFFLPKKVKLAKDIFNYDDFMLLKREKYMGGTYIL